MRELHDGIELLEEERDAGPFVWRNWDKWDERCEQVITWLDNKIRTRTQGQSRGRLDAWKNRGFLCGVEWSVFKKAVDQYRAWLDNRYGGSAGIRQRLIFAHNDVSTSHYLSILPLKDNRPNMEISFDWSPVENLPSCYQQMSTSN
jgi:choline kinase